MVKLVDGMAVGLRSTGFFRCREKKPWWLDEMGTAMVWIWL
jgi:hypothetical protein